MRIFSVLLAGAMLASTATQALAGPIPGEQTYRFESSDMVHHVVISGLDRNDRHDRAKIRRIILDRLSDSTGFASPQENVTVSKAALVVDLTNVPDLDGGARGMFRASRMVDSLIDQAITADRYFQH